MGKKVYRWIMRILRWYLIYVLIGILVPPMIQQSFTKTSMAPYMQKSLENSSTVVSGDSVPERAAVLTDNEDALVWRLRMIGNAKKSIVYTTFAWHDGRSGRQVMAALHQAAQRGVDVKVLIDGFTAVALTQNRYFRTLSRDDNVEVKIYNPVPVCLLLPFRTQYRMHDKYMITDGQTYLLGGRNTYNLFLGSYGDHHNVDYEMLVDDPEKSGSVLELEDYFKHIWSGPYCRRFSPHYVKSKRSAGEELDSLCSSFATLHPALKKKLSVESATIPVSSVKLISGQVQPSSKDPIVAQQLLSLCRGRSRVLLQTPYIICNREMYEGLKEDTGSAAKLEVMTNAVENGANPFGCTDYLSQKKKILGTGTWVCEWLGGQSLHAKMLIIDDSTLVIGSWNMDMRSTYLDTELMLAVDSKELASQMCRQYENMRKSSRTVSPDGSYSDGTDYQAVTMSAPKKIYYGFIRVISWLFRYML